MIATAFRVVDVRSRRWLTERRAFRIAAALAAVGIALGLRTWL